VERDARADDAPADHDDLGRGRGRHDAAAAVMLPAPAGARPPRP
jgi:hypothetical protein